jgi:iron complex outermembrane receptor protein
MKKFVQKEMRARLLLTAATGVALAFAAPAMAQEEEVSDEVVVKGFRQSLENSAEVKRNNTSIVEAVTAEDIGKLPDISIAESLGRLPGIATQRLDGRSNVVTIRGLGPDFSTALLNGREQVSVNDNRGVEFDQYPSELLTGALVYKTPYAGLIGQGLAGTVDLQTIRPLKAGKQIISFGGRYEFNDNGSLNPDSPDWGWRGSATIVDQFADDRVGVALGVAYQSSPTQNERFNAWGYPTTGLGEGIIGGAKPFNQSNDLDRFGLMGIIEFQPADNFRTAIDLYYSKFDETQRLRGIEFPLFWSSATLQPGYTVQDGLVTKGTFNGVKAVMRNDVNQRDAELFAAGWNGRFDNGAYGLEMDISYSRADRHDDLIESYSGTAYGGGAGLTDNLSFELRDGFFNFTPTLDYSDPSLFVLTDPQGWGGGTSNVQAGFINSPDTQDELWHFKAQVNKYMEGALSNVILGFDFGTRNKQREIGQNFLNLPGGAQTAPLPTLLDEAAGMAWLGIPAQITYDPLPLLTDGTYVLRPVGLSSFSVPQSWDIEENVMTFYARGEIEAGALTGNIGVQALRSDQTSSGFRVDQGAATPTFIPFEDGDEYWHFLPSLNLIYSMSEDTKIRASVARTLVRARMDALNASLSLGEDITKLTSTDPLNSYFSASGGNPQLRPYTSWGFDLSLEHYFGGAGYVSVAGFYKDLSDYVFPNDGFVYDFANFVATSKLSPAQQALLGTTLGRISGPTNNGKGSIKGFEASVSLPFEVLSAPLEGFGILSSVAFNDSEVLLGASTVPITVPGLSKWVVNSTAYFEKAGFEARVSHRYRSDFLAEVAAISATRDLRFAESESIIDAQIGYRFQGGALEGLNVYIQGNNLTDEPFITFDNEDVRYVRDFQSYGRTFGIGANYSF